MALKISKLHVLFIIMLGGFSTLFKYENFVDIVDWLEFTFNLAKNNKNVIDFKPHPLENWYEV